MLGYIYSHGNGVEQNYNKAKEYYELSAKQNNLRGIVNLGVIYLNGYGVEQDCNKAIEYFKLSAKQNGLDSLLILGCLYLNGYPFKAKECYLIEKKYFKAKEYYELSAQQSYSKAIFYLEFIFNKNGFITDMVDEAAFLDYQDFVKEYHSSFDLNNSIHFEDFIRKKYAKDRRRKSTLRRTVVQKPPQLDDLQIYSNKQTTNQNDMNIKKSQNEGEKNDQMQKIVEEEVNQIDIKTLNENKSESNFNQNDEKPIIKIEQYNATRSILIGLFGSNDSNKSMIMYKYLDDPVEVMTSIDYDFSKVIEIDGNSISTKVASFDYDFVEMRLSYLNKCNCYILVFTIDDPCSIMDIEEIYDDLLDVVELNNFLGVVEQDDIPIVVAANNVHLRKEKPDTSYVSTEDYKKIEKRMKCPVIDVSTKTGEGIDLLFSTVIRKFLSLENKNRDLKEKKDKDKEKKKTKKEKKSFWSKHFGKKKP